jgi:hypothetical protein
MVIPKMGFLPSRVTMTIPEGSSLHRSAYSALEAPPGPMYDSRWEQIYVG